MINNIKNLTILWPISRNPVRVKWNFAIYTTLTVNNYGNLNLVFISQYL